MKLQKLISKAIQDIKDQAPNHLNFDISIEIIGSGVTNSDDEIVIGDNLDVKIIVLSPKT